jgi:superfamily II DNA or RNA helicase
VEVGRVQGPTVDYQGRSIVVATLQSLYQKDYPQEFYDYFGLVIVDEVHHCPSRAFSLAISKVNARWRCGLSATPSRKDGLDDLIFYAMGDIAAYGRGQFVDCDVFVVPYSPPSWMRERDYVGNKGFSQIIKYLTRDAERNKILVRVITGAASKPGNKVLVLTKRVKQAELLTAAVASIVGEDQVGFFPAGKTKKLAEARASARSKNVTILTWQLGSEGVDFPEKNFLVVTAPSPDIEQAVGRVRRIYPGKERVNVVYLADELAFLPRITQKVIRFCERPGPDKGRWPVRWVDL